MAVLLIHGVGGRPRTWRRVRDSLPPEVCRQTVPVDVVVRPGRTVRDVARTILTRYPGSHVLVGHSLGGMLAQEMALIDHTRVRGMVLVSTIPGATARVADINLRLADAVETHGITAFATDFAAGLFAPGRLARDPELGAEFVDDMCDAGATSVCSALRAIVGWSAADRLADLDVPTTVLAGDAETDLDRQSLLAELLGTELDVLPGTGHLAPLESPAAVAHAVTDMVLDAHSA